MNIIDLYVDEEDSLQRIDSYLSRELDEMSRSFVQKLIKEDLVKVNNRDVKASYIVKEGDNIRVQIPKPKKLELAAEDLSLDIIFEDEDIAIINKASGMVVHPAPGNYSATLVNGLLYQIKNLSSINGIIRPGIVHRLDKDTSGLLIIAKNNQAHRIVSQDLKDKKIKRLYMALVHGQLSKEEDTINAPIGRHPVDRKKMTVIKTNSKEAVSHYRLLDKFHKYSLVEVALETGRTHQIRVHMAYISHPIVGDPVYSRGKNEFNLERQLLHAYCLGFHHPTSREYMEFKIPLAQDFQKTLDLITINRK